MVAGESRTTNPASLTASNRKENPAVDETKRSRRTPIVIRSRPETETRVRALRF
jgi:hypothetical protein